MTEEQKTSEIILKKTDAEMFARLFNVPFNNVSAYGGEHPSTQASAITFFETLSKILETVSSITMILERDSVYIEEWCVDKRVNAKKITNFFKKTGIQSISFEAGVKEKEIMDLFRVLGDINTFDSVEKMKGELNALNVNAIKLNYVFFQKITEDDAIVDKKDYKASADTQGEAQAIPDSVIKGIGQALSLKNLMENPDEISGGMLASATKDRDVDSGDMILKGLKQLNRQIRDEEIDGGFDSVEQMLEAVYKLKLDFKDNMNVQAAMGRVLGADDKVINELDDLTHQAIVRLIKEEYKSGNISVKRLGQIIRRMLPDMKELKRLLPRLKESLLAEGMPLADFLTLVQELDQELQGEDIVSILNEGAEEFGLSADEIIKGIKENPAEAAKLIVLASEIRHGVKDNDDQLSNVLTEYIERVSGKLTIDMFETARGDGGQLEDMLTGIENGLLDNLRLQGVKDSVLQDVKKLLSDKFNSNLDQLKSDWLEKSISNTKADDTSSLLKVVVTIVKHEGDLAMFNDPLRNALESKGYSSDKINDIYKKTAEKIAVKDKMPVKPKRIINAKSTLYFIQHQIYLNKRYDVPFSCLALSVTGLKTTTEWEMPVKEDLIHINSQIYFLLDKETRVVDIIGAMEKDMILVILPVTREKGLFLFKERLEKNLNNSIFYCHGKSVIPDIVNTGIEFDKFISSDLNSYLKILKIQHKHDCELSKKMQILSSD